MSGNAAARQDAKEESGVSDTRKAMVEVSSVATGEDKRIGKPLALALERIAKGETAQPLPRGMRFHRKEVSIPRVWLSCRG